MNLFDEPIWQDGLQAFRRLARVDVFVRGTPPFVKQAEQGGADGSRSNSSHKHQRRPGDPQRDGGDRKNDSQTHLSSGEPALGPKALPGHAMNPVARILRNSPFGKLCACSGLSTRALQSGRRAPNARERIADVFADDPRIRALRRSSMSLATNVPSTRVRQCHSWTEQGPAVLPRCPTLPFSGAPLALRPLQCWVRHSPTLQRLLGPPKPEQSGRSNRRPGGACVPLCGLAG